MRKQKAASQRVGFTKRNLEALAIPAEGERIVVYDKDKRGLGLLTLPSKTKSYFWFRRVKGTPTRVTIGRLDDLSVEQARAEADRLNVLLADWKRSGFTGPNPFERKTGDASGVPTFFQL